MQILVNRTTYTEKSTISDLSIDGKFYCYVLEDKVRGAQEPKIYGKTAIPAGTYQVIVNMSNRFGVLMPLYLDVQGFSGVRLHYGNSDVDTDGCSLVGMTKSHDFIGESRKAYALVFPVIKKAYDAKQKITITFRDNQH